MSGAEVVGLACSDRVDRAVRVGDAMLTLEQDAPMRAWTCIVGKPLEQFARWCVPRGVDSNEMVKSSSSVDRLS